MSDLSATNTQLFFLSGSKRLLWSEVERFFSHVHAAVFSLRLEEAALELKLNDFSATNMQLFFLSGSKKLLQSDVERSFSYEHAAVFSCWIKEAALEQS